MILIWLNLDRKKVRSIRLFIKGNFWCWHICLRDCDPRRPWPKETIVQGTVVQGDIGPCKLLSKGAFTSDNLARIDFFFVNSLEFTIANYEWKKILWTTINIWISHLLQKSSWSNVSMSKRLLGQRSPWAIFPHKLFVGPPLNTFFHVLQQLHHS